MVVISVRNLEDIKNVNMVRIRKYISGEKRKEIRGWKLTKLKKWKVGK